MSFFLQRINSILIKSLIFVMLSLASMGLPLLSPPLFRNRKQLLTVFALRGGMDSSKPPSYYDQEMNTSLDSKESLEDGLDQLKGRSGKETLRQSTQKALALEIKVSLICIQILDAHQADQTAPSETTRQNLESLESEFRSARREADMALIEISFPDW